MSKTQVSSNLQGRLRNTNLPKNQSLMPLFEAVVNSIQSLDDSSVKAEDQKIIIDIERYPETEDFDALKSNRGRKKEPLIKSFKIIDNGLGFNSENWASFQELDSQHKLAKGCRGVGRLLWLKAFETVRIESSFLEEGKTYSRVINFSEQNGFQETLGPVASHSTIETIVELKCFLDTYSKSASTPKTTHGLAQAVLDHCLWYFLREGCCAEITIKEEGEVVSLNDLYEEKVGKDVERSTINVNGTKFELTHLKFRTNTTGHKISYCAENRLVKSEKIDGKLTGLHGDLEDDKGNFSYTTYVTSDFLDDAVRVERDDFSIPQSSESLFEKQEVTFDAIRSNVLLASEKYLSEFLEKNKKQSSERISDFISNDAPHYRPIAKHLEKEESFSVDPNISKRDLDLLLHKKKYELEQSTLNQGHKLEKKGLAELNSSEFRKELDQYLSNISDLKKSDLAEYVGHRKVVINLLEKALGKSDHEKYQAEEFVHNFFMPMRTESDESINSSNLWLIDDRLAFHDFMASDKTLSSMPITDSKDTKEPDLLQLQIYDNPIAVSEGGKQPLGSLVIVEIKRPMRDDYSPRSALKDPINQSLDYLMRIRKSKVQTRNGRPIANADSMPAFCYILADVTPKLVECCESWELTPTSDGQGYFGYHKYYNSYIEVISFDRMLKIAKERNRVFFEKLGIPSI